MVDVNSVHKNSWWKISTAGLSGKVLQKRDADFPHPRTLIIFMIAKKDFSQRTFNDEITRGTIL